MRQSKLNEVSRKLNLEKLKLMEILPLHLQADFAKEGYISGGCIYSLYNDKEPKDYDFFVESESFALKLRGFFMSLIQNENGENRETKSIFIVYYNGQRIVVTKNAISMGKYQIITKFTGTPDEVVSEFDFKHNMFYHRNDRIETLSDYDFLESNSISYNESRARDISGTIIRVNKFVQRGMTITNSEMSKMLRKLRDVGFNQRENEIIDSCGSY